MISEPNLTPDEREAVLKVLQATIAADRFPLSPRIRTLKSALAKLDPDRGAAISRALSGAGGMGEQQDRAAEGPRAALTRHETTIRL